MKIINFQIALRTEQSAVKGDGLSWGEYNEFMNGLIKEVSKEQIKKVPKDLDLTPYEDEKDYKLLQTMVNSAYESIHLPLIQQLNV